MPTYPSSLAVTGLSRFDFIAARPIGGFIPTEPEPDLEELTCPGVDYAIYRDRGLRFRVFHLQTVSACASQAEADALVAAMLRCKGQSATLQHTARGVQRTFQRVRITNADPEPMPGVLLIDAAYVGVRCTWTIQLTERPSNESQ